MSATSLTVQETDSGLCLLEGIIESDHAGFMSVGYANSANATGLGLVWHVYAPQSSSPNLSVRYANGATTSRPGMLSVNGKSSHNLEFAPTGAWTGWETIGVEVDLVTGYNTLSLVATQAGGLANIDSITLDGRDLRMGNCATARINTSTGQPVIGTAVEFIAEPFPKGGDLIKAFDWNFGDGSAAVGKTVSHRFTSAGSKTVTLAITDNAGEQSVVYKTIDVKAATSPIKVFIAGDSTVSTYTDTSSPNDQAGWGQMLREQYTAQVTIDNHAVGGRTARRFIDEGRLTEIWNGIRAGDYLLVQFGTNDGHRTATYTINGQTIPYYLAPQTDYKSWLQKYVDGAKARGVQLVFVTPPPRNSAYCTGGNGTAAHAQAMRELAAANQVPLVDLNAKLVNYLMNICPSPVPENFFLRRSDGTVDGTHFQENGARIMSKMVADGMAEANLAIAELRR